MPKKTARQQGTPQSVVTSESGQPVLLVNALRTRDVYVLLEDVLVLLPRVPAPTLIPDHSTERPFVNVLVPSGEATGDLATVPMRVEASEAVSAVVNLPPRIANVWYLVDPATKTEFPHRDDFVVPSSYSMWLSPKTRKARHSKSKKKRRKAFKKDADSFSHAKRFPLASIRRGPLLAASEDTPVLTFPAD